ncbi:MAG: DUF2807 domain-containing protein [Bacteroidales bacterium]|jgi:hypothetical protein|nr:DUF2807 domain-containing protein [Bacteroidales bacterium]
MKNLSISVVFILFFGTGCISISINSKPGEKGNGSVTIEQRSISSFDKIDFDGVSNIFLLQSDIEKVEVEIDDNLQKHIHVYNNGHTLVIKFADVHLEKTTKNNIYISYKEMNQLAANGVGNVKTQNILNSEHFKLNVTGVGNVDLELNCNTLDADFDGVGNINLRGKTDHFYVKKDGVGSLNAKGLIAEFVDIHNSGVGSASVYANEELKLKNSGVGSISYSGDANIKSINSDGVGRIKKD